MAIFIDTGDVDEIRRYHGMGIIRGVTTNPTILFKCGLKGGRDGLKAKATEIARIVSPLPVSVELTDNDTGKMVREAQNVSKWAKNIVVKVPVHGPDGELENLRVIHELEASRDIRVNATAIMSAQQGLLAAMAGATYVSLFCGRVNNMGYDSRNEIMKLRQVLEDQELHANVICASTREALNVIEWLNAGAHIVTVTPSLIEGMIVHPYTKETVRQFISDAART
jgi:transaldolase